jgi:cytochrome P450
MISTRRELQDLAARSLAEEKHDIFNQIIQGHDENDTLSEDELIGLSEHRTYSGFLVDIFSIGNAFIFLIAGHDTTAHSLALALALLALYPEEQAKLVREIQEVRPDGGDFVSC